MNAVNLWGPRLLSRVTSKSAARILRENSGICLAPVQQSTGLRRGRGEDGQLERQGFDLHVSNRKNGTLIRVLPSGEGLGLQLSAVMEGYFPFLENQLQIAGSENRRRLKRGQIVRAASRLISLRGRSSTIDQCSGTTGTQSMTGSLKQTTNNKIDNRGIQLKIPEVSRSGRYLPELISVMRKGDRKALDSPKGR